MTDRIHIWLIASIISHASIYCDSCSGVFIMFLHILQIYYWIQIVLVFLCKNSQFTESKAFSYVYWHYVYAFV